MTRLIGGKGRSEGGIINLLSHKRGRLIKILPAFILAGFASLAFAQEKDVAVTVYSNNLGLIKEVRTLRLPQGTSEVRFTDVAASIDPASVHFKSLTGPGDVSLIEQTFAYDLINPDRTLQKYIDQEITVHTEQGGTFRGRLLSASDKALMLRMEAGNLQSISSEHITTIDFPALPEGLITRPTLVWLIDSQKAGEHRVEVSYLTRNMSWHAEYVAVCKKNDSLLELNSWVSIDNQSGADYRNARLQLMAGDVHRATPQQIRPMAKGLDLMVGEAAPTQFEEKQFFEYHLYTLQRRATVKNNQVTQIALFPPAEIKADKIYCYNGALYGDAVRATLTFQNSKGTGPGSPLPKGKVRVFKQDAGTSLQFVGEDIINHTPQDEKVRIYLGNAFDIKGERVQKEMKQLSERSHEETWQITLRNHKREAVRVIVEEQLPGDWKIRKQSHPYKKKDAATIEFEVPVEKEGETVVEYTVLIKW